MKNIERVHKIHGDEREAVKHFTDEAQKGIGKKWLGVFVSVEEDGSLLLARTTWNFPSDRFLEAVAVLAENLAKEPATVPDKEAEGGITGGDFQHLQEILRSRRKEMEKNNSVLRKESILPMRDDDPIHVSQEDKDISHQRLLEALNGELNATGGFAKESLKVPEAPKANVEEDKS